MTEMRTAIHNEGEAVYQCVPLGAHLAEVARLEAENKRLRDALQNVVDGNDLALERRQSIENWRDSAFRKQAIAALAGGKGKDDAD